MLVDSYTSYASLIRLYITTVSINLTIFITLFFLINSNFIIIFDDNV
ncbi:type VI secretion system tube protein IglC [Francisella tularensis]